MFSLPVLTTVQFTSSSRSSEGLSVYHQPVCMSVCLPAYLYLYLSVGLFLSVCLFYIFFCLAVSPPPLWCIFTKA